MTVQTTQRRVSYVGDGVTTLFPVPFAFLANADLVVTGGGGFSVSGAGNPYGGTVTFAVAPAPGVNISILRVVQRTQEAVYVPNDPFPAKAHEGALDKLTMIVQEDADEQARLITQLGTTLRTSQQIAPLGPERAGKYLAFDADGQPVAAAGGGEDGALRADLAAASGAALVGYSGRSVASRLGDSLSVKDRGAIGDGVTDDSAAFATALSDMAADGGGVVYVPPGVYNMGSTTVVIPSRVTLRMDGATLISSAVNAVEIAVVSLSLSGALVGSGHNSIIEHSGTGYGISCEGIGAASANVLISNVYVKGTSAGDGGLYTLAFNRITTFGLKINGYTTGSAHLNRGTNAVTHFGPVFEACLHGQHNLAIIIGSTVYSANAVRAYGGSIVGCTGWGWLETKDVGASVNLGNLANGVVFENNGVFESPSFGHAFVQAGVSISFTNCYFEDYAGGAPESAITIGDAANAPESVAIIGNIFATSGTNVVRNWNGQSVRVLDNHCAGAVDNFVFQDAPGRGLEVARNRGAAVANMFAGSDGGDDTIVDGGAADLNNHMGASPRGIAFNSISGANRDLEIFTRLGGAHAARFLTSAGSLVASVAATGAISAVQFDVGGTKVVGAQRPAIANSGDATVNAILAALRAHGLIAT